jgi:hypothetical protein
MLPALQINSDLRTPRKETAWPQSQLPHSCKVSVSDLYNSTIRPPIFLQQNRQTDRGNIYIAQRNMNVGTGTAATQFDFFLGIFVSNFRYNVFAMRVGFFAMKLYQTATVTAKLMDEYNEVGSWIFFYCTVQYVYIYIIDATHSPQ